MSPTITASAAGIPQASSTCVKIPGWGFRPSEPRRGHERIEVAEDVVGLGDVDDGAMARRIADHREPQAHRDERVERLVRPRIEPADPHLGLEERRLRAAERRLVRPQAGPASAAAIVDGGDGLDLLRVGPAPPSSRISRSRARSASESRQPSSDPAHAPSAAHFCSFSSSPVRRMSVLPRSKITPRTGDVATPVLRTTPEGIAPSPPNIARESMSPDSRIIPPLDSAPSAPRKIRVAVLLGGPSPEREVSLRSGEQVVAALDPAAVRRAARRDQPRRPVAAAPGSAAAAAAVRAGAVRSRRAGAAGGRSRWCPEARRIDEVVGGGAVDVAFIAMHGPYGEDGTSRGCSSCSASRIRGRACSRARSRWTNSAAGRCCRRMAFRSPRTSRRRRRAGRPPAAITARVGRDLGYPCVVKPNAVGSSIGVPIVRDAASLPAAVDAALEYGDARADRGVPARHRADVRRARGSRNGRRAGAAGDRDRARSASSSRTRRSTPRARPRRSCPARIPARAAARAAADRAAGAPRARLRGVLAVDLFLVRREHRGAGGQHDPRDGPGQPDPARPPARAASSFPTCSGACRQRAAPGAHPEASRAGRA